jgi:hypothetical protein
VVSTDGLMDSVCRDGLFVVHDEHRRVHAGKNIVVVDSHGKDSRREYKRLSQDNLV